MKLYITLDLAKKHLNVDSDYHEDDGLIMFYLKAAQDTVQHHIDCDLEDLVVVSEDGREDLPPTVTAAILLYTGTLYAQRESISYGSVSNVEFTFDYLLSLYKNYNGPLKS